MTRLSNGSPAVPRKAVHKVGLAAAAVGLLCLASMPFAVLRSSRIATGSAQSLLVSVGALPAALLVAGWLAIGVLSLSKGRGPWRAAARSLAGAAVIVAAQAGPGSDPVFAAVGPDSAVLPFIWGSRLECSRQCCLDAAHVVRVDHAEELLRGTCERPRIDSE